MNADLKRLVHDRSCELPPASVELLGWLGTVEEFVSHVKAVGN